MAQGRLLGLRLFLEGIETDVIGCNVSAGINQPAQCSVEIPVADSVYKLKPRTLVHVFFMESAYRVPAEADAIAAKRDADVADPKNWKLLFAGEVLAVSFTKAGALRHAVLQCQDFTSYWSSCQLYWGNGSNAYNSLENATFLGATRLTNGPKKFVSGGAQLANILAARPTSLPTLSGVLGGVVSLLESATGVYEGPKSQKNKKGVNDFMTQAELRLHLTRMIGASGKDTTSEQFLKLGDLKPYFAQVSASTQSTASFMDLANTFLGKVYHQTASVIAPPYSKAGDVVGFRQVVPVSLKIPNVELKEYYDQGVALKKVLDARHEEAAALHDNGAKAKALNNADDVFHTVNESGARITAVEAHEKFDTASASAAPKIVSSAGRTTATASADEVAESENMKQLRKFSAGIPHKMANRSTYAAGVEDLRRAAGYIDAMRMREQYTNDGKDSILGQYRGHNKDNLVKAREHLDSALEKFRRGTGAPEKIIAREGTANSRLISTLITPDLYMAPPPKCNVLFPDHYMNIQFGRQWLAETSRLLLYGRSNYGQPTMQGYMSPNNTILNGPKEETASKLTDSAVSFLMPHERFTGPIPAMESQGDMAAVKKINQEALNKFKSPKKGAPEDPAGSYVSGAARFAPQEHMQRAANYLFFAKRFASRSMHVEARFSPQIIVGLPMLVLDPVETSRIGDSKFKSKDETVAAKAKGTHFIGLVASVSHQLAAHGGASTSISLTKCREHREGLDVFGDDNEEGFVDYTQRRESVSTRKRKARVLVNAGVGADGKSLGDVSNPDFLPIDAVLSQLGVGLPKLKPGQARQRPGGQVYTYPGGGGSFKETTATYGNKTYTTKVGQTKEDSDANYAAEAAIREAAQKHGKIDSVERAQKWYTAEAAEKVVSKATHKLSFTFEATATPPWFSYIYLPSNIGNEFYQDLIGCRSVIDDPVLHKISDEDDSVPTITDETITVTIPSNMGAPKEVQVPRVFTERTYSTAQTAEQLAEAWAGLQKAGADIPQFVETYTARSYATLQDILGSPEYNPSLRFKTPTAYTRADLDKEKTSPAFHADAFGEHFSLNKPDGSPLLEESLVQVAPTKKGAPVGTTRFVNSASLVDTRAEKYQAVLDYVEELERFSTTGG